MPRVARTVIPGCPHHVIQRGNNQQDVFFNDDDRRKYLELLHERCSTVGVRLLAYCLMSNHTHLVVVPMADDALARGIGRTHFLYTQHINREYGRSGHLWQNRFFSCPLDMTQCWNAVKYIEANPVADKMVEKPEDFAWSSARVHAGMESEFSEIVDLSDWSTNWSAEQWVEFAAKPFENGFARQLNQSSQTGRPFGSDEFIDKLERHLGRRLRPLPVGRPPKRVVPKLAPKPEQVIAEPAEPYPGLSRQFIY